MWSLIVRVDIQGLTESRMAEEVNIVFKNINEIPPPGMLTVINPASLQ